MASIKIVFWSQTGNTEAMAKAIGEGVDKVGGKAEVIEVGNSSLEQLKEVNCFALGCPAMGNEVLEEMEMEPFVEAVEQFVSGKKVALFGSYGWGDGEWMQEWQDRMLKAGAEIIGEQGLICQDAPDEETIEKCKALGAQLANL